MIVQCHMCDISLTTHLLYTFTPRHKFSDIHGQISTLHLLRIQSAKLIVYNVLMFLIIQTCCDLLHWAHVSLSEQYVILICLQYTILDDGCVCMEFFRVIGGVATVLEVMRISANGLQVTVCNLCIDFLY